MICGKDKISDFVMEFLKVNPVEFLLTNMCGLISLFYNGFFVKLI